VVALSADHLPSSTFDLATTLLARHQIEIVELLRTKRLFSIYIHERKHWFSGAGIAECVAGLLLDSMLQIVRFCANERGLTLTKYVQAVIRSSFAQPYEVWAGPAAADNLAGTPGWGWLPKSAWGAAFAPGGRQPGESRKASNGVPAGRTGADAGVTVGRAESHLRL
jgi:hypothetical protein